MTFKLPFTRCASNCLWTVFRPGGAAIAISDTNGGFCLPLFSTEAAAKEWLRKMHLERDHYVSAALYPRMLIKLLSMMKVGGFTQVALDPPASTRIGFPAAYIEGFIEQARAKVRAQAVKN